MTKIIEVKGLASGKLYSFSPSPEELKLNTLFYLKDVKSLPVASSCDGEGICKKCNFNQDKLLCNYKVSEINELINISYL